MKKVNLGTREMISLAGALLLHLEEEGELFLKDIREKFNVMNEKIQQYDDCPFAQNQADYYALLKIMEGLEDEVEC